MKEKQLEEYLTNGVRKIVKGIARAAIQNPQAAIFMTQFAIHSNRASELRKEAESRNCHIPPFLIASITTQCNLYCSGCYARAGRTCGEHLDKEAPEMVTAEEWTDIFGQAAELGISFILLAGGEPFLRSDVLKAAGKEKKILFPVFTNGTMIGPKELELLEKNQNVIPILSIEGRETQTDCRRGAGVYQKLLATMQELKTRRLLFGASVTVTRENQKEVMEEPFLELLSGYGCKAVVYVEYVPVDKLTESLAIDESEREAMMERLSVLRNQREDMLFIAFPGDEKSSGGCLAAGRGFFHINPYGGVEPCPFSPFSDTSLKDHTVLEALESPLFMGMKTEGFLQQEHTGGCVLFEQEAQIRERFQL